MFRVFWQVWIGEIGKEDVQNAKEINSKQWNFVEILDFKYLNFFLKKNHSFAEFFDKISDPYNKTTQKIYNFFENHRQVK